jgi:hypothetical protein
LLVNDRELLADPVTHLSLNLLSADAGNRLWGIFLKGVGHFEKLSQVLILMVRPHHSWDSEI